MSGEPVQPERSRDSDALEAAFDREGCPVCIVILEHMHGVIDSWQYEGFTDVEHRHEVIRTRGFCPLHTWQVAQLQSAFQLAIIYREVFTDILTSLERDQANNAHPAPAGSSGILGGRRRRASRQTTDGNYALPAYQDCYFCRMRDSIEQRLLSTILSLLATQEMREHMSQSTGLCLPHFLQARALAAQALQTNPRALHDLLDCQQTCMKRVLDEVQELVRKHDYRFKNEPRGDEMVSWRRAAMLAAGNPGVR